MDHPEPAVSPPNKRVKFAADYFGVDTRTIRIWIAEGKLPAYRIGTRTVRLRQSDLDNLLQAMGND
jgi:excisionase family DNA binding protein